MSHRSSIVTLLLAAGLAAEALAQAPSRPKPIDMAPEGRLTRTGLTQQEKQFVASTVRRSLAAADLSAAAAEKAASADVKRFAEKMANDQRGIVRELSQFVTRKGATVPATMGPERKTQVSRVTSLKGAAFDRAYSQWMLRECGQTVSEFRKAGTQSRDAGVKAWANKSLPLVSEHLRLARGLPGGKGPARK
jgi:putative membrane protein